MEGNGTADRQPHGKFQMPVKQTPSLPGLPPLKRLLSVQGPGIRQGALAPPLSWRGHTVGSDEGQTASWFLHARRPWPPLASPAPGSSPYPLCCPVLRADPRPSGSSRRGTRRGICLLLQSPQPGPGDMKGLDGADTAPPGRPHPLGEVRGQLPLSRCPASWCRQLRGSTPCTRLSASPRSPPGAPGSGWSRKPTFQGKTAGAHTRLALQVGSPWKPSASQAPKPGNSLDLAFLQSTTPCR